MLHRNSQKRIITDGLIYFVTTVTQNRLPYFKNPVICDLFIEELKVCKKMKKFNLYAFCILKEHLHLMIEPGHQCNISEIMRTLKTNFSRNVNYLLEGGVTSRRLQFGRNDLIKHYQFLLQLQFKLANSEYKKFYWQGSYFDHIIRNDHDFDCHLDYTIFNYEKHYRDNYPDNYQYSSLNYADLIDLY
jgi:putative transposase